MKTENHVVSFIPCRRRESIGMHRARPGFGLHPFRGLPNPKEVWAWGMYDLANQSFTLLVITMFGGLFVKDVIAPTPERGDGIWGSMVSASMLAAVVISPFIGAVADARAWKKEILIGTGLICSLLTCAFAFLQPGQVWIAAAVIVPAYLAFNLGENFLGAFLPEIATRQNMGRISATGWAMGYVGALVLLIIAAALAYVLKWEASEDYRPIFVIAGVWFLLAATPTILFLKEKRQKIPGVGIARTLKGAGTSIAGTVRDARHFRQLLIFLLVFFVFSAGTYIVIAFAGIITKDIFGFGPIKLTIFLLQTTVTAGIAAVATGKYQDRIGHRRTVMFYLAIWTLSTTSLAGMRLFPDAPEWLFWVLSNGVGFGLGGIGTSSRALVGTFTPAHKTAEFFGLWGMVYKLSGVVGPLVFGLTKGKLPDWGSLLLLSGFFALGFIGMFLINERAGAAAAEAAEGAEAARTDPGSADATDAARAAQLRAPGDEFTHRG